MVSGSGFGIALASLLLAIRRRWNAVAGGGEDSPPDPGVQGSLPPITISFVSFYEALAQSAYTIPPVFRHPAEPRFWLQLHAIFSRLKDIY